MIFLRLGFFSALLFCFSNDILGQRTIYLDNPSFEDIPRVGTPSTPPIKGWQDCGIIKFPGESPPDIQPMAWGVETKAFDGKTYLSMVVRDNDTWESVSQKLKEELIPGKCYTFNAALSLSPTYESKTKRNPDEVKSFSNPIKLVIWGGSTFCDKSELLAESTPVDHEEWLEYPFEFKPTIKTRYLTLEAFYFTPILESYNGHILIDDLSPIIEISCD